MNVNITADIRIYPNGEEGGDTADMVREVLARLAAMGARLEYNIQQEEQAMADFSTLQGEVSRIGNVNESVKVLVQRLADMIANAPDQAAIDAIVEQMRTGTDDLAEFVVANTPADGGAGGGGETPPPDGGGDVLPGDPANPDVPF